MNSQRVLSQIVYFKVTSNLSSSLSRIWWLHVLFATYLLSPPYFSSYSYVKKYFNIHKAYFSSNENKCHISLLTNWATSLMRSCITFTPQTEVIFEKMTLIIMYENNHFAYSRSVLSKGVKYNPLSDVEQ